MLKTAIFLVMRLSIAFFKSKVANKPIYSPIVANSSEKSAYDQGEKRKNERTKKGKKAIEK